MIVAIGDDRRSPVDAGEWDDGTWVVVAYRLGSFWRPHGMTVKRGSTTFTDAHYIAVSKKVAGEASWPQFLVLYSDGNLRLIPHPPAGRQSVCFGASVIVGPAEPAERPYCDIRQVEFDSSDKSLTMTYESGGTACLSLSVDRTAATVRVRIGYSTDYLPFATLRSMFVRENNCDTALVTVNRQGKPVGVYHVLEPFVCIGSEYVFHRDVPSTHNMSAPGIIIRPTDPSTP